MKPTSISWLLALIVALFGWAVWNLFQWRFAAGDIYPPYSSFRSDPLGSKALYESLESLPHLQAQRQLRSLKHLPSGDRTTLLVLGTKPEDLDSTEDEVRVLEGFTAQGGRLVITLTSPEFAPKSQSIGTNSPPPTISKSTSRKKKAPAPASSTPSPSTESLEERWGFKVQAEALPQASNPSQSTNLFALPVVSGASTPLQRIPSWHSLGILTLSSNVWKPFLLRGTNAVAMERPLGRGSVAIATESYFVSNEALRHERSSELIAWAVGGNDRVIFEETHLGIHEDPGFAALARRYRLEFFGLCLGVLSFLFIWRSHDSFCPSPEATESEAGWVKGRDASSGFVGLLRRNIPPPQLMRHCLEEWVRSRYGGRALSTERLAAVQKIVDEENLKTASKIDPIGTYQKIADLISIQSKKNDSTPHPTPPPS